MPTKNRPPSEVISSISSFATQVREGGNELTERIERFQSYLSEMRGRVETCCFGEHPDEQHSENPQAVELGLRLHKEAKNWVISYSTFVDGDGETWKLLKDAPLKFKIAGIKMFPDLLEAIETTQEKLVKKIATTAAEFDAFEKTLKTDGRAGG